MSAGYTNLRTVSYRDTIAELIARANQTHTRATGVQVFSPGDGMAYEDTEGFINPISPALFDDAKSQIAEASEALVATEAELEAAQVRIDETTELLGQLDEQAGQTAEEVAGVVKDMEADRTRLTAAQADLDALKPRLGNVETAISESADDVAKALSDSAAASEAAEVAKATMDSLQAKLDAALKTNPGLISDPSFESPDAWQGYAGVQVKEDSRASSGKNVLYMPPGSGASAYAYARQPANVVKGHKYRITVRVMVESAVAQDAIGVVYRDGSALTYKGLAAGPVLSSQELVVGQWALVQWDWESPESMSLGLGVRVAPHTAGKAVDDFQVVDVTEQADLRLQIEDAKQEAIEAAAAAQSAAEKAGQAITASSGKATVTNKTTTPQGVGLAVGDIWFQWTAFPGGVVIGQWSWSGSDWVPATLSHEVIASLDLGKATVGELDGGRIKAHSMEADRLTIGVGQNAIADPMFSSVDLTNRRLSEAIGTWTQNRAGALPFVESSGTSSVSLRYASNAIPTVAGQKWRIQVQVNPGGGRVRANVRWFNAAGVSSYVAASSYVTGTEDTSISTIWEAPATAVGFLVDLYAPGASASRTVRVYAGISVQSMTGAVHIEDGAITASKVNAEEVAGALGQFIKVQAENVEVTDTLAARVLSAATSQVATSFVTDRLVVGTGDDRTVLEVLGTAVANDLNLRGTLRGRDAILDGTLDVEQLNVTKGMSAKIVSAMEVDTKKLIVTEAAVMQHITAIEGIITPKITASEAKMGNLIAQKASIADIEAGNLTLTGHFRSGAAGKPGVIIPQNYTTQAGFQQLGIWLAPTGVAPSLGSEWGSTAGIWLDEAANVAGTGARSRLHIRGQSGAGVDVYGQLTVHKYPGSDSSVITAANGADLFVMAKDGNKSILYSRDNGAIVNATGTGDASLRASGSGHVFVRNSGTGTVVVRSEDNAVWVTSATNDVNVQAKNLLRLRSDDRIAMQKSGGDGGYDYTGSSGSKVDLTIHPASGVVNLKTSARRFKTDIQPFTPDPRWLDQPVVSYLNKQAVERWEEIASDPTYGPLTQDDYLVLKEAMTREVGTIADDAADYGAGDLVAYDADGEVLAWDYARETVVLRHFMREHRDRIADLEARIAELESALL